MGLLKDHLISLREELEKKYNRSFACSKCDGKGFIEIEILGDGENFECDVVGVKTVSCDECF